MRNRDLATLRMIARVGSFREAAERLNMTISAVSMQMKALEADLGGALFDRSLRPPRLTALGRSVAETAGDVLDAETRLRALARPDAPLAGRFRLGLVASAGPRLLPGFVTRARAVPEAYWTFHTGLSETLEAEVATGALDAAVVTATGVPQGGMRHRLLAREPLATALPDRAAPDLPFLQFAPGTGIGRIIADERPRHPGLAARPVLVLDHVATILALLDAGHGATMLPAPDFGRRAHTPLDRTRDLVLVTRAGTMLDAEVERLAALLV
ncbi:LysR family transcriptional regulator [uncultured Jannaschia sp.]|uniref:LysR family transcriptional regulator n=1 Tax=uncultured Jannaschia sp. TaxID=293347 RepID=UPI00262C8E7D|nr:LysR family transcriptional regulator [uncultured Jannaschia sp.]